MDSTIILTTSATLFIIFISWLSFTVLSNKSKVEKSLMNDESAFRQIEAITDSVDGIRGDIKDGFRGVNQRIDLVNQRIDLFTAEEINFFKKIIDKK